MTKQVQLQILISEILSNRIDRHVRATGVNKDQLVEQALLHHLQALEELPAEFIVPPRVVVVHYRVDSSSPYELR